jgi:hypothetical protein
MSYTHFALALTLLLTTSNCGDDLTCHAPVGHWTDREGREWVVQADGQILWLTKFGSQADTQRCRYTLDCNCEPARLDLSGFDSGPFREKTLLGIIEWSSDTSWRWQYDNDARPWQFTADGFSQFFKK